MTETVARHDFIEVDFTGKLTDGTIFDTTVEKIAKEQGLYAEKLTYQPLVICVGEQQVLPGLDKELVGKEIGKEYTLTIPPELAFGKREVKKIKIVPLSTFQQHKVQPHPGLQVEVDGERGVITQISGGRVMVNFNHPLAGKEVIYQIKLLRKITNEQEKVKAYLQRSVDIPEQHLKVEVQEGKATVELPFDIPTQITDILIKKLEEITALKEITFTRKAEKA